MNVISIEQKANESEALKDKYLLTIKEAAFYFNIGTKKNEKNCRGQPWECGSFLWKSILNCQTEI